MSEIKTRPEDAAGLRQLREMPVEELSINTIRTLAMDAVQEAASGHPGTPMALAPAAYVLWRRHLRHNPRNPDWFDRDRFVLSNGHASMLLYALLHLTGYDLPLEEIRNFRQLHSRTPGHPENFMTPGVETTTGPLGQGVMTSVGLAIAEAHLSGVYNRTGHPIVDHRTYAFCSDGDLMEGASHEAASLAGHLGLGKLTWLYDDNHITIEGDTALAFSEDVEQRFRAYGWHVQNLGEKANDLERLDAAFAAAGEETKRPSLIIVRSHIGYGAPNKQDTASAHGSPLGEDEVRAAKRFYGWPEEERFLVPDGAREHMGEAVERGEELEADWTERLEAYRAAHPELATQFEAALDGEAPDGWDAGIPTFVPDDGPMATRAASGRVLNAFAGELPWLMGGSADLAGSNKSMIESSNSFARDHYDQRNMHWGVREHVMCAASSGMALHRGVRPYAASFFIFTDYARPAIRLASMMQLPVIYIMTHDSIGLGEDGPTHQPIEHLASLRAMPHIRILRPADANEAAFAWRVAVERTDGPTMLVLTRQKLPIFDRENLADAAGVRRGAYVLASEPEPAAGEGRSASGGEGAGEREGSSDGKDAGLPDVILIGSGSEVRLLLEARERLSGDGIRARVVSMPSWELFREQPPAYREEVLPPSVRARLAVEAGSPQGWREWVGDEGDVLGMDRFGASAPWQDTFRHFGFTAENVTDRARALLEG